MADKIAQDISTEGKDAPQQTWKPLGNNLSTWNPQTDGKVSVVTPP